jgi:hypothetical protein
VCSYLLSLTFEQEGREVVIVTDQLIGPALDQVAVGHAAGVWGLVGAAVLHSQRQVMPELL